MNTPTQQVSLSELAHFLPRQLEATREADTHTYTLYGGSAGPGKSYWLRWYPIRKMMQWGQQYGLTGIHGALFSKDYTTLKDRQMSKMEIEFPRWLGEVKNTKTDGIGFHLHPSYGGHVLLLRNLDDPSKYLSSEFAIIAQEEVTENEEETFHRLRGRLRWTGIPDPKWIGATNPGGVGHGWVKKFWIDREFPEEMKELANDFVYVKALPSDNPYLAASYMATLNTLPEKLRKAYRDGNWDVFEGQYFTEWDREKHVVAPFPIPLTWKKFRSIDPSGRDGITSCHWYALDPDGRAWVYREYYYGVGVTGADGKRIEVGRDYDEHAKAIRRLSEDENGVSEDYAWTTIDTAAFAKAGFSETAAEIFERHGVTGLIPSAKERVVGWNAVHYYLRWQLSTLPLLRIFSNCVNMIRTIPLLQHDPIHPEDVDSRGEDHAADELRYIVRTFREQKASRPLSKVERKMAELNAREDQFDYSYSR